MALPQPPVVLPLARFNNVLRKKFPTKLHGGSKCARNPDLFAFVGGQETA